ncbi:hypothetical protein GCM10009801_74210 [Streptomyces albiaxialis]|uniref:DUF2795 domain-containing protein n=1 Tax=Streptomyces albiaxialis TaxID=329523 RepID=A0ABN2WZ34_9ACTN
MTQHGRDKMSPVRDDEIKKEMQGELKADRALRVEEEHELQPAGDDQPEAGRAPEAPLATSESVALRSDLARHLERGIYPADRSAVLACLRRNHAPDRLLDVAARLPAGDTFTNVQDLADALGLETEESGGRTA